MYDNMYYPMKFEQFVDELVNSARTTSQLARLSAQRRHRFQELMSGVFTEDDKRITKTALADHY